MKNINILGGEVLGQMLKEDKIFKHMSATLKTKTLKIGINTVLTSLLMVSSGVVQADTSLNGMLGLSGLVGLLANNTSQDKNPGSNQDSSINCNAKKSGLQIAGAGALGSFVGNQIGGGTGKDLATVAGGVLAMVVANEKENASIRNACQSIPTNITSNVDTTNAILYAGQRVNGGTFTVTVGDSPGIAGLSGKIKGTLDVNTDDIVKNALEQGSVGLVASYDNLDAAARNYYSVLNGKTTVGKLSRYTINPKETGIAGETVIKYQEQIDSAKNKLNQSYSDYASMRAYYANVADNAVLDGYDITAYNKSLPYFMPPKTVNILFNGQTVNRYETLKNAIRP